MALTADTIPEIVSSGILDSLQKNLVYSRLFNTDYIGEVVPGNAVKIPAIGSVTVKDYTTYTDMDDEAVTDSSQTMSIDQQKYFSIVMDDIDAAMSKPAIMAAYAREAAFQLRDTVDQHLAGIVSAGTLKTDLGTTTTPLEISTSNAEGTLNLMARQLDEAKVPRAGRVVVVPPWFVQVLTASNVETLTNNVDVAQNGFVGRYAGFDVLMSHNVPNTSGSKYKIIGGTDISATYGLAINKTETLRHEKQFADKLRGLAVYGSKLTRPATIVVATCDEA